MRKPDLFDEIIQFLRESGTFSPSAPVNRQILDDLFAEMSRPDTAKEMKSASAHHAPQSAARLPQKAVSLANIGWDELARQVAECRQCVLHATRTNVVLEDGSRTADLMFIGEGPGADEDAQGLPFVGRAGELLTRMINAMQFQRSEVYIANIVKCRPPENRLPEEAEAMVCMPFLKRQIELVQPKVIVLLGATPLKYIMGLSGISKLRGQWLNYNGAKVMPTFHPAYLLRNPPAKKPVWEDLQLVMKEFGKKPQQSNR